MATTLVDFNGYSGMADAQTGDIFSAVSSTGVSIAQDGGASTLLLDGGSKSVIKTLPAQARTIVVGMRVKFGSSLATNSIDFLNLRDGTNDQISVRITSSEIIVYEGAAGAIELGRSTMSFSDGVYYHIELGVRIGNSPDGTIDLSINGVPVLNLSGIGTQDSANNYVDMVRLASGAQTPSSIQIDHHYVGAAVGLEAPTMLGETRSVNLPIESDAPTMDWTPSTGVDGFAMLDDPTPATTDFVSSVTNGQRALFNHADLPAGNVPLAMALRHYADKDDGGASALRPVLDSGGTVDVPASGNVLATNAPVMFQRIYPVDPNGSAAWTEAAVNAALVGFDREAT